MKLKTLKDIDWDIVTGFDHGISPELLKQEAIKFVKRVNEYHDRDKSKWSFEGERVYRKKLEIYNFDESDYFGIIGWIKWFFNITEKDMEEK